MKDKWDKIKKLKKIDENLDKMRIKEKRSEDFSVVESVFDKSTLMTLYSLHRIIDTLHGVVSTGKEANVYHALDHEGKELAVKIYRTVSSEFVKKGMLPYIHGDPRFKRVRHDTRSLIFSWAEKEFKNLSLAKSVGVRVPEPIIVRKNILIMEFIGEDGIAAPRLKDVIPDDPNSVFKIIFDAMIVLFQKANLIHADLSEYNILMWDEPVIIDISQAVLKEHPMALKFLYRDLRNIIRFFSLLGVNCPSVEKSYYEITGEEPIYEY